MIFGQQGPWPFPVQLQVLPGVAGNSDVEEAVPVFLRGSLRRKKNVNGVNFGGLPKSQNRCPVLDA